MKKIMVALLVLLVSYTLQSCRKIKGEGPVVTKDYTVQNFSGVDIEIGADVYYTQGSSYKVVIEAQTNIQNIIETGVVNGDLVITFEKYKNIRNHHRIAIYITTPSLTSLNINGSGSITASQPVTITDLNLKVNGSGDISLANVSGATLNARVTGSGSITINGGSINSQYLKISGSGNINTLQMSSKTATTETSGSGKTTLNVSDDLSVQISGSGDVYYTGNPSVHTSISGSGKVSHM